MSQPRAGRHVPERTCVGCRAKRAPRELVRLVCAPDGQVVVDRTGRFPGRGAYTCYDVACLRQALKSTRLAAVFNRPVTVPAGETIYRAALDALHERLAGCLSMAQKAGAVVAGYRALLQALHRTTIVCLVLAEDIAAVRADEYRLRCAEQNIPCVTLFTKERLGRLIGRASRSAVGLLEARFCTVLCHTMGLLERLQSGHEQTTAPGRSQSSS